MKEDVIQRIKEVYVLKATSETQFAKMIGISQRTINQQFKGERSLSLDSVLAVLSSFEDISAEWLMRGKGEMFLSEKSEETASSEEKNEELQFLRERIISLEAENKVLREVAGLQREREQKGKSA